MRTETQPTSTFREPSVKRGWVPTRNLRGTVLVTSRYLLGTFQVTAGYLSGVPSRGTFQGYLPCTSGELPGRDRQETFLLATLWRNVGGWRCASRRKPNRHNSSTRAECLRTFPPLERRARSLAGQAARYSDDSVCAGVPYCDLFIYVHVYLLSCPE